jgi:hypothetical protein
VAFILKVAAVENALVIVDQAGPLVELAATLELAANFARASKARTTLAAYRSDWRVFERAPWRRSRLGWRRPVSGRARYFDAFSIGVPSGYGTSD